METMPILVEKRLKAMSLADLDIMAKLMGEASKTKPHLLVRVDWISRVMTTRMIDTFNSTLNEGEVIASE